MAAVNYKLIKGFFTKEELPIIQKYCFCAIARKKKTQNMNQLEMAAVAAMFYFLFFFQGGDQSPCEG